MLVERRCARGAGGLSHAKAPPPLGVLQWWLFLEVLIRLVWSIRSFVLQVSTSLSLGVAFVEAHHYTGLCAGGGSQIPCVAWRGRLL